METTEVQRVPGVFNLPDDWPTLDFPDLTTGLIADFHASDLPVGGLEAGWKSAVGTMKLTLDTRSAVVPQAVNDSSGRRVVRFSDGRLVAYNINLSGPLTYVIAMRPTARVTTGNRRVMTGNLQGYRALTLEPAGVAMKTATQPDAKPISSPIVQDKGLVIAGRFGAQTDGYVLGSGWSATFEDPDLIGLVQDELDLGANASSPPTPGSTMQADVYRVQVFNRVLTKTDVEAAAQNYASAYGFA